jgi:histone H3/H4
MMKDHKARKTQLPSRVMEEIKKAQHSESTMIPKARFQRVVKGICKNVLQCENIKWTTGGLDALQFATE